MTQLQQILSPREPLPDSNGQITRSWWRFLNGLHSTTSSLASDSATTKATVTSTTQVTAVQASGLAAETTAREVADTALSNAITAEATARVAADSGIAVEIDALVSTADTPLVINAGTISLDADASLAVTAGTRGIAKLAADSLLGNSGTVAAQPGAIEIGPNLTLSTNGTLDALAFAPFLFVQDVPSATWTINHDFGTFPSVVVIDSSGAMVEGDINYISTSQIVLEFVGAFSGSAYFN